MKLGENESPARALQEYLDKHGVPYTWRFRSRHLQFVVTRADGSVRRVTGSVHPGEWRACANTVANLRRVLNEVKGPAPRPSASSGLRSPGLGKGAHRPAA